jgi:hypothetical protein
MKTYTAFIPGNVPSSKNSRQTNKKTGRSFVSKIVQRYYKSTEGKWMEYAPEFRKRWNTLPKPWIVYFHFIRDSKRRFDFINPCQTVQDRMVHYDWLEDDNSGIMIPMPLKVNGSWSLIDKDNTGCIIHLTRTELPAYEIKSPFTLL